jgi:DNA polymerase IIIc chi subunit
MRCSVYNCLNDLTDKTLCNLTEKAYLANIRTVILFPDLLIQETINKLLWTRARLSFIPHGSSEDMIPEEQPVYLTHKCENPNRSEMQILFLPQQEKMQEIIYHIESQRYRRICLIKYEQEKDQSIEEPIYNLGYKVESFIQTSKGLWSPC